MPQEGSNHQMNNKELVSKYERSLARGEAPYFNSDDFIEISNYYLKKGSSKKALDTLQRAIQIYPYECSLLIKLSSTYLFSKNYTKALEWIEKANSLEPNNSQIFLLMGQVLSGQDKYEEAEKNFQLALKHCDHNDIDLKISTYLSYTFILQENEQYDAVFAVYKQAFEEFPQEDELFAEFDFSVSLMKKEEEAIELVFPLVKKDPLNERLWYLLATCYERLGHFEKAVDAYDKVLCLNENNETAIMGLSNVYLDLEQPDKAIELLNELLEKYTFVLLFEIYLCMAQAYEQKADFTKARMYYLKVIEHDEKEDEAWYGVGLTYLEQEKYEEALRFFEKATELNPLPHFYWYDYGRTQHKLKLYENAEIAYNKSIDIFEEDILPWIDRANLYFDMGHFDKAVQSLREGYDKNPDKEELLFQEAAIHFMLGKVKEGGNLLESALLKSSHKRHWLFYHYTDLMDNAFIKNILSKYPLLQ